MVLNKLEHTDVRGKRVFLRADLNVPLKNGIIQDDSRLQAILPTIDHLIQEQATIILATHIGKPQQTDNAKPINEAFSTKNLIPWFINRGYHIVREPDIKKAFVKKPQTITLLENLRFFEGEQTFNPRFAEMLATIADVYVNDAFSVCHRTDTSITLLPEQFPAHLRAIGINLEREITNISAFKNLNRHPYVMMLGGKKVATKMKLLLSLLNNQAIKPDSIMASGVMATMLLQAQGYAIGLSYTDPRSLTNAQAIITSHQSSITLPTDVVVQLPNGSSSTVARDKIPADGSIIDIGPESINYFSHLLQSAGKIFSNGTVGIYEHTSGQAGTLAINQALKKSPAFTMLGGGDALASAQWSKITQEIDYCSTGGGATLAFLASTDPFQALPGLRSLVAAHR